MLSPAARNVPAVGPQAYGCLWLWLLTFCPFREELLYWFIGHLSLLMDTLWTWTWAAPQS